MARATRSWRAADRRSTTALDRFAGQSIYRGQSAFIFAGASRSALDGVPEVDGLIKSTAQTLRGLKPSEFPLAEPYRIKVVKATDGTKLSDYAADMPEEKFKKETLELINAMYPNKRAGSRSAFQDRRVRFRQYAHTRALVALIPFADRVRLIASLELANHG